MKWYTVAEIDVTDPSWVREYVTNVTEMVGRAGDRFLARTTTVEKLEGDRIPPQVFLIGEWPSRQLSDAFYTSAEYQPYRKRRLAGARNETVVVAGDDLNGVAVGLKRPRQKKGRPPTGATAAPLGPTIRGTGWRHLASGGHGRIPARLAARGRRLRAYARERWAARRVRLPSPGPPPQLPKRGTPSRRPAEALVWSDTPLHSPGLRPAPSG
jgi:uncharacterized protein (DUF1330 family)